MSIKGPFHLQVHPRYYVWPLLVGSLVFAGYANANKTPSTQYNPNVGEPVTGEVTNIKLRAPNAHTQNNIVTMQVQQGLSVTFNATDIDLERLPLGQGVTITLRRCPAILGHGRTGTIGLKCLDTFKYL